jgi:hypothetical protein
MRTTLRFIGEQLDPGEISRVLGMTPTQSGRRGDPIVATLSRGRTATRPASSGYWVLAVSDGELPDARAELENLLRSTPDPAVWKGLGVHAELTIHEAPAGQSANALLGGDIVKELDARGVVVAVNED